MGPAALAECCDDELGDTIGQVGALEAAVRRTLLDLVTELDRRGSWRADGAATVADWLVYRLGCGKHLATELVRVARALERLPAISAAFGAGRLSWDQVRAVTRFATPATDTELADEASTRSAAALERLARRARPVDPDVEGKSERSRSLRWRYDHERATLHIRGRLPAAAGAVVVAEIERRATAMGPDPATGTWLPSDIRAADALVELASEHLAAAQDRDPDRSTVVVHSDIDRITGATDLPAEIEQGPVISEATLHRLMCDARMQLVVEDDAGNPVVVTRTRRTVPAWLARQLRDRDRSCRFPGCSRIGFLQAHHVVHAVRGGRTETANLILLCWFHHGLVHDDGGAEWEIAGDPSGALAFRRPDGRVLMPGPPPLRSDVRERIALS